MEDKRLQGLEEGCVVHLLKVENAIVPADAVLLWCSGFLGFGASDSARCVRLNSSISVLF